MPKGNPKGVAKPKAAPAAKGKRAAGSAVAKSKGPQKVPAPPQAGVGTNLMSPVNPTQLKFSSPKATKPRSQVQASLSDAEVQQANSAIDSSRADDSDSNASVVDLEGVLASCSSDELFQLLVTEVPSFQRFKTRWDQIGSLSAHIVASQYDPDTAVSDFIRDLSTATEHLDRPTSIQVLSYFAYQVELDTSFPYAMRRPWVLFRCKMTGREVPELYSQETVNRYALKKAKRKRTDAADGSKTKVSGKSAADKTASDASSSDDSDDSSDDSSVDGDDGSDDEFSAIQKLPLLNASTVWGKKAGFNVIPHAEILKQHADKAAEIARTGADRSKSIAVVWPKLLGWSKSTWITFERKWWTCVNQAVDNGCYSKIISLVDLDLYNDIQQDLKIKPEDWFATSDIDFLRKAHGWFGPTNNEQAKQLLSTHECRVTAKEVSPTNFIRLLSTYNTAFMRTLDLEIAPSVAKWPKKGKPKHGPLTLKSIRHTFKQGFSHDKDFSESCKHCFNVCDQNPKWSHAKLYSELRSHFLEDEKSLMRPTLHGGSHGGRAQTNHRPYEAESNGRAGGKFNKKPRDGVHPNGDRDRPSKDTKTKDFQFKIVKGADRGKACGDYTDHYGKGCSARTCIYWGTPHAKEKNYKWKDSDKEPKVTIPSAEFQALKNSKPDVVKTNNANRDAYRASKGSNYPSSSSAIDSLPVHDNHDILDGYGFVNHSGDKYIGLPPHPSDVNELVAFDMANMNGEDSSLAELGWKPRFYGIAAFLSTSIPTVPSLSITTSRCNLLFAREIQHGRTRRPPRKARGEVQPASHVNVINSSIVSLASEFGKLKQVQNIPPSDDVINDGRPRVCLMFDVAVSDDLFFTKTDWFVIDIDNKQPLDGVTLRSNFAAYHKVVMYNHSEVIPANLKEPELPLEHKRLLGSVFFDNGSQMSCISSALVVPHLCISSKSVNASITQMGAVVAHCTKAVQMQFELFDLQMQPTRYIEWFLVFDNPYGIVLGEQFCRPFTTWRENVASWDNYAAHQHLKLLPDVVSDWMPSPHQSNDCDSSSNEPPPAAGLLNSFVSKHPVSGRTLNHRDAGSRPIIESVDHEYIPQIHRDLHSNTSQGVWNEISRRSTDAQKCVAKEKRLYNLLRSVPDNDRVAMDVAELQELFAEDQRQLCLRIHREIIGLPVGLMMGCGLSGLVKRAHLFEPATPQCISDTADNTLISSPAPLARAPLSKSMQFFVQDLIAAHKEPWSTTNQRIRPWKADVEQVKFDALNAASQPQPALSTTAPMPTPRVNAGASNASVKSGGKRARANEKVRADTAPVGAAAATKPTERLPSATPDPPVPAADQFADGTIIRFCNCIRLPEFNGKLGRLYDETVIKGVWRIRVLGKDGGQFVKANQANFVIHNEQRRFASSSNANFHDVGLDDTGMPVESADDMPKPVHRQFGKEYSADLTKRIKAVLDKYPQLFDGDISEQCLFEEMDIQLKPNSILPSRSRYYRNTPRMKEEVRRQVQEQLEMGIISKAQTPVVSNVLLVKRPHMPGRFRFVVDFREINAVTVPEQLMMPDVKSQHDRLANKKIFGAVDISSYYRLIGLKSNCRYLTGFATDEGTYVYNRVPMGVRNACSHAQRVLQDALAADKILGARGANIRNYFDDIAWGCDTEEEFLSVLEALMRFGVEHKLKFNAEKSCFGVDSITHVGFIVSKDGVSIDPERTRDIVDLQPPKSTKKVQSILGVLNFVRNFIPNFSIKAKFLTDRLEKAAVKRDAGKHFVWTPDDDRQFLELKELVLTAPLLSVLDYSAPIFIRCDSSRFGAGAVLFQYDADGREMPVCYASRKYTATETRYSTFQQKMGAVVWALERFQEYCMGYPVIVETDHRNISYVKRSAMPQLARWRMRLEAFDFEVHYRCGALQQVADGLSRSGCDEDGIDAVAVYYKDVLPECTLANAAPAASIGIVHVDVLYVDPFETAADAKSCQVAVDVNLISDDDSDIDTDGVAAEHELLDEVPDLPWHDPVAVQNLLKAVHNDLAGHGGVLVTLQRVLKMGKPQASRKQMLQDIDAFLKGCVGCQKMRKRTSGSAVTRRVISGHPFEELSIDILKLPFPDAHGNMYVVTIVDNFSHWVSTYACANKSAVCAVRALIHHIGVFGVPLRIRSDGGGEFCNDIIVQLTHMLGTDHLVVLPYAHTANGIAERANRAILERLRFILFDRRIKKQPKLQWSDLLPLAQRIINSSVHSAIGTSPARLIFGDHVDIDRCILSKPAKPVEGKLVTDYVDQLSSMQLAMFEAANQHQLASQEKVIAKANKRNEGKPRLQLSEGDLVLVKPLKDFPMHKLAPRELGPRVVIGFEEGGIVALRDPASSKQSKVFSHQCELFDVTLASDVEGQTIVAETDSFEFAVDGILAHGIDVDDDDAEIMALGSEHARTLRPQAYAFLIKWAGYEKPTWVGYKAARLLPHFANYVDKFPNLRMGNHA